VTLLDFLAEGGFDYYIVVDSVAGREGAFGLDVRCTAAG
jgi:hypothetical protein